MTGILIPEDAACSGKTGRGLGRNVLLCILRMKTFCTPSRCSRENLDATLPVALGHVEGASSETAWLSQTQGMAGMENFPSQAASAREDSRLQCPENTSRALAADKRQVEEKVVWVCV